MHPQDVHLDQAKIALLNALESIAQARQEWRQPDNRLLDELAEMSSLAQRLSAENQKLRAEASTQNKTEALTAATVKTSNQRDHIKGLEAKLTRLEKDKSEENSRAHHYGRLLERCRTFVVLEGSLPLESVPEAVEDVVDKAIQCGAALKNEKAANEQLRRANTEMHFLLNLIAHVACKNGFAGEFKELPKFFHSFVFFPKHAQ